MGEVYRARDTRLDRVVAIKVLPEQLWKDQAARQRFEREARAASSLNHPHICALYDVGSSGDVEFLVMEHLDGETLAARLTRGALPVVEAVRFAIQIAAAMDRAHQQGLVHRDLKPGNIMLTKTGAKVLDFGLARTAPSTEASSLTQAATATSPLTAAGTIVGTYQYMAPEQIEGEEADARSDIFAFGLVMYEMVTGRRAFQGKTQASLIAAILEREPEPISALAPMSPPALERLVTGCLAKDPQQRRQSMHDLLLDLEWIAEGGSQLAAPAAGAAAAGAKSSRGRERLWMLLAGGLALVLAAVLIVAVNNDVAPEARTFRSVILAPQGHILISTDNWAGPLAVSPDGRSLAFAAVSPQGQRQLWVRALDALEARPLAGTDDAYRPFWSPDSRQIGFFSQGKLKRIDLAGGPALALADAPVGRGGTWSADGTLVYAPSADGPLLRIPSSGGTPVAVTDIPAKGEITHRYPSFLPDGRHFLYMERSRNAAAFDETAIYAGSLDSKDRKLIVHGGSNACFASGYLLFARDKTLFAQPFDPARLETTGDVVPIAQDVLLDRPRSHAVFSASNDGILAYQTGGAQDDSELRIMDRSGRQLGVVGERASYSNPRISPDGKHVAVSLASESGNYDIWTFDLSRNVRSRLTFGKEPDINPYWSPDGARIAYSSAPHSQMDLFIRAAGGSGGETLLYHSDGDKFITDWSRDGRYLLYTLTSPGTRNDLWYLPMTGGGEMQPKKYLATPADEIQGRLSPDGRWSVFVSDDSGRSEVYVSPFPRPDGRWQISRLGGTEPRWSADGKQIFYRLPNGKLMDAHVSAGEGTFEATQVDSLFDMRLSVGPGTKYDLFPDGRILVSSAIDDTRLSSITLVVNWTNGLKTR